MKPGVPHSRMEIADRPKLANNIKLEGGTNMNNTQNQKIAQVTDKTLIVGVDIGRLLFTDIMTENRIRQKPYSVREKHV